MKRLAILAFLPILLSSCNDFDIMEKVRIKDTECYGYVVTNGFYPEVTYIDTFGNPQTEQFRSELLIKIPKVPLK